MTCQKVRELHSRYAATDEPLLISVSRMAKEKDLDFLINGLAKEKELIRTPFKCLLVGEAAEKTRLEEKAIGLGLDKQVVFTGNLPPHEVARCYLAAYLFVLASASKTRGMVLIETIAGGCPVLAARASGGPRYG